MIADSFMEILKNRRSIRRFKDTVVPKELVSRLIEAATWAPSAGNRQNWEFTVVTAVVVKIKMAEVVGAEWTRLLADPQMSAIAEQMKSYSRYFDWFAGAPVLVVLSAKSPDGFMTRMFGSAAADVAGTKATVAMAAQNLMLAAQAAGVGSCCLTAPLAAHKEMRKMLDLGNRQEIVCVIALGYADDNPLPPPRKAVETVVRYME